jgi:hypothetical protein
MSETSQESALQVGDWVRFQHGGRLLMGSVVYLRTEQAYPHKTYAVTDEHGAIPVESVIEFRRVGWLR